MKRVRELSLELPNNESLLRVLELNRLMEFRLLVRLSGRGLKRLKRGAWVVVVLFSVVRILKSRNRVRVRVGVLEVVVALEEEKEEPENLERDLDLVRERGGDSSGTETCRLK